VSGSNFWNKKSVLLKGFAKNTTKIATQFLKVEKKGFAKTRRRLL